MRMRLKTKEILIVNPETRFFQKTGFLNCSFTLNYLLLVNKKSPISASFSSTLPVAIATLLFKRI